MRHAFLQHSLCATFSVHCIERDFKKCMHIMTYLWCQIEPQVNCVCDNVASISMFTLEKRLFKSLCACGANTPKTHKCVIGDTHLARIAIGSFYQLQHTTTSIKDQDPSVSHFGLYNILTNEHLFCVNVYIILTLASTHAVITRIFMYA